MKFIDFYLENKREVEALLIDIDGTLLLGDKPIGEVERFIDILHEDNVPFCLLTNDGNHSIEEKQGFLANANLDIKKDEIISCGSVLKLFAKNNPDFVGKKFFVLGELGTPCYAELAGFEVTRDINELDECVGVMNGEGIYDWRPNLEAVLSFFLKNHNAPYVVPNPDSFWPSPKSGQFGIGAGGQARMIVNILHELHLDFEPTYLGKPYGGIYEYALSEIKEKYKINNLNLDKVYCIGDSLSSDIAGGNRANLKSVLVLSGITRIDYVDNNNLVAEKTPDMIFDS